MTDLTIFADFDPVNFTLTTAQVGAMIDLFFTENSQLTILNLNSTIDVEEYESKNIHSIKLYEIVTCKYQVGFLSPVHKGPMELSFKKIDRLWFSLTEDGWIDLIRSLPVLLGTHL